MRVQYAEGEELKAEKGTASNVLDGNPKTIWHTNSNTKHPNFPHIFVLDLGVGQVVEGQKNSFPVRMVLMEWIVAIGCMPVKSRPSGRAKHASACLSRTCFIITFGVGQTSSFVERIITPISVYFWPRLSLCRSPGRLLITHSE